jgi:predicted ester cyclase
LTLWQEQDWSAASRFYDYRVHAHYPGAQFLYGADQVGQFMRDLQSALPDLRVSIDHTAEIGYLGDAKDVAVRWSIAGHHQGHGRYGSPTGAAVYILGVSQFRVINGRIREEYCVWDDVAVRRQIESARSLALQK